MAMEFLLRPLRSSLGRKYLMALTGLALIGFVVVHMVGNLLIYAGPDALNSYAQALKARPPLLWGARAGLLAVFLVHLYLGITLTRDNTSARPIRYAYEDTVQASWASRHMFLTGLVLLAFILYHLAHFTLGVVKDADGKNYLELAEVKPTGSDYYESRPDLDLSRAKQKIEEIKTDPSAATRLGFKDARQDVYSMVISGFRNPWITGSYLVAMVFLWLHLWHGGSSWFQSLGMNHPRYNGFLQAFGPVLATVVLFGNCSIPLSVLLGLVK
jgi:succinate dehydrogenase / fumarate reductase cytochrome b subunit